MIRRNSILYFFLGYSEIVGKIYFIESETRVPIENKLSKCDVSYIRDLPYTSTNNIHPLTHIIFMFYSRYTSDIFVYT